MIKRLKCLLTAEQCAALVEATRPRLTPALVQYGQERRPDKKRVSENHRWRQDCDESLALRELAAELTGKPLELCEPIDVVHYKPGGYFGPHHDGDFRSHTLLVALTDDYEGGETDFPNISERIKLRQGDGILWPNDTHVTVHQSLPVTRGEKWAAVVWVRNAES